MGRIRSTEEKLKAYKPDNPELFKFKIKMTRYWNLTVKYAQSLPEEERMAYIEERINTFIEKIEL